MRLSVRQVEEEIEKVQRAENKREREVLRTELVKAVLSQIAACRDVVEARSLAAAIRKVYDA